MRQQYGGLVGALVVLEPGERWDPTRDLVVLLSDGVPQRVYINGSLTPAPIGLQVGKSYRLRVINITIARPGLRVSLRQDSSLVRWKLVSRDGAQLPVERQIDEPAVRAVTIGQTFDVELKPERPGTLRLTTVANVGPLRGTLEFRVAP
jgi:FtsP/CotA-like multicopper oxidase with cupredoxin domain